MHNNYYFLRQLSKRLEPSLTGTVISECYSQSKDELIIRFETHTQPFFIKANVNPQLSALSFPQKVERARKNSVDLFPLLVGQRVKSIRQFANERSFSISMFDDVSLLFKMHGNRSNIIVFGGKERQLFQTSMQADWEFSLDELDRHIDFSYDHFVANISRLPSTYFTFGKWVWKYLDTQNFSSCTVEEKWSLFQAVLRKLEDPEFYISRISDKIHLMLLPFGEIVRTMSDPVLAANEFFYNFTSLDGFLRQKQQIISQLTGKIQSNKNFIDKNLEKLNEVKDGHNYKVWGDLIMANLHMIKPNAAQASLANFYDNDKPAEVKLKPTLSPQKNAETYYRKAKNQQIEIQKLQEAIEAKERENSELNQQLVSAQQAIDLRSLRGLNTVVVDTKKQPTSVPYREYEFKGYRIFVGRNAEANDELTLKFAIKDDLWLHAKDVSGSHVVIKHQSGKNYPKDVIEYAAQLAAYHSKRKTDTLCPVIYTPKKFVRKRKGDPAGLVVVERETVIMVEPKSSS